MLQALLSQGAQGGAASPVGQQFGSLFGQGAAPMSPQGRGFAAGQGGGQQGGGLLGSFSPFENGSLQGVLGGIGREGGGLLGKAFGSLFGGQSGNVDFGGGFGFIPGAGFANDIGSAMPWL